MIEFVDQIEGVALERLVIDAGIRHVEIEDRGQDVEHGDHRQGHFADRVDAGIDQREVEGEQGGGDIGLDQGAADDDAEDDGADGEAFDPAVGDDEQAMRQVFGEDAVFGRRVGRGAEADDGVGDERMGAEEHQAAADDLDRVADEHDPPFRHRVGEGADESSEQHIRNREKGFQQRLVLGRRLHFTQGGNRRDEQGVVGQRGKELRGHDDVKAKRHLVSSLVSYITLVEGYTTPSVGRKACAALGVVHVRAWPLPGVEKATLRRRR